MSFFNSTSELRELVNLLTEQTGYPLNEMSVTFLKRRLTYIVTKLNIRNIEEFGERTKSETFIDELLYSIPVDCTELFRDPGFWRTLIQKIIPKIIESQKPIWFPDASSGHELFSWLILLKMFDLNASNKTVFNHPSNLRLAEIKAGITLSKDLELAESNFKRLEINDHITNYLSFNNHLIQLNKPLLTNTISHEGWYNNLPNLDKSLSLIVFRNTGLCLQNGLFEKTLNNMYEILSPGGYIAIGIKEALPNSILNKLELIDKTENIYKKPGVLTA